MKTSLLLGAYRSAGRVLAPTASLILARRAQLGKEDLSRRGERLGYAAAERPDGVMVWIHAASVGETISVLPLIERIRRLGPRVLLTTGTLTSAKIAAARIGPGVIHQFVPLDFVPFVERFLDHWRPDLALFVESEIWPAMTAALRRRRIMQILVNGRMSERSFQRWQKSRGVIEELLGGLSLCLAQSYDDGDRFSALGAPAVRITGNLKYDVPPPGADDMTLALLQARIGGRPTWLAASTHPGEDGIVARVHRALKKYLPGLMTIIAPRHPQRGEEIETLCRGLDLKTARRSAEATLDHDLDIYIADTIGELGLFYRLVPVAFVGGSLVNHGGQNPIEPAKLDTVVLHGPHVHNFSDIYRTLDISGGGVMLDKPEDLARAVGALLTQPEESVRRAIAGAESLMPFLGALDRTMDALGAYLTPLAVQARLNGGGRAHEGR